MYAGGDMSESGPNAPRFVADLESWGSAHALIGEDGGAISYSQLAEMADRFAASLPDDVKLLAIEAQSRVEAVVAYLGALRSHIPVLLHSGGAAADHILNHYRPDACYALDGTGSDWRLKVSPVPWNVRRIRNWRFYCPHPVRQAARSWCGWALRHSMRMRVRSRPISVSQRPTVP